MNYVLQGFGVFLGVIAGVAINLLTQFLINKHNEKSKINNLRFELKLNIEKIDSWIEEITRYRNALNSDTLHLYFGYYDLSKFVSVTANELFANGTLYKYLIHGDIGKIQVIYWEFSLNGENFINNQVNQNKEIFGHIKADATKDLYEFKTKVVQDINFWEEKFKLHKKTIEEILSKLGARKNK